MSCFLARTRIFRRLGSIVFLWFLGFFAGCGILKHPEKGATSIAQQSQGLQWGYTPLLNISVDSNIAENEEMGRFIQPFSDSLNRSLSAVLARIDTPFYNTFYTGNLGRLVADYMLLTASEYSLKNLGIPCHFAVANNGGLRAGLFPGAVTMRHVFEVMPFDNELVILQLSGGAMDSLFRYIVQMTGTPVSGLILEYEPGEKPAKNVVVTAKINSKLISKPADLVENEYSQSEGFGKGQVGITLKSNGYLSFDSRRDYLVATSSYMAMGGDGFTMLKGAKQTIYTGIPLREAIANGLKREYEELGGISPRPLLRVFPRKGGGGK